jgi:subtilisin family serine protease
MQTPDHFSSQRGGGRRLSLLPFSVSLCLCGFLLGCAPSPIPRLTKVEKEVEGILRVAGRAPVIVILAESETWTTDAARSRGITSVRESVLASLAPGDFRLEQEWSAVNGFAGELSAAGLDRLQAHPQVVRVGLDRKVHGYMAESGPMIRADEAHALGFTGRGATVAVLDTGVDDRHPDLKDAIVDEQCFCSGCCPNGTSRQSGPGSANDDNGHGTNVAGIIASAGRVAPEGIAPDAGLVVIRVLGPSGGSISTIVSALEYVLARPHIKVVNMSLGGGGPYSTVCDAADAGTTAFATIIARLRAQGTLTVVAAGNEGFSTGVSSPACVNAALAVGAVYDQNVGGIAWQTCPDPTTASDQVACFSNSSPLVELLAPGALTTSSGPGGGTLTEGGTSQATPHVAGAAAVLLQARPSLTPSEIIQVLAQTGVPVVDRKNGLSLPRINLRAAIDAVR